MGLTVFLIIGTALMIGVMLIANKWYQIQRVRITIASIILTLAGVAGAMLMARIETGVWGGTSFYGAVFFAPFLMILVSRPLRISASDLLDLCAPSECIMLFLLKIHCYVNGCCYGKIMKIDSSGNVVRFPSQLTESVSALVLMLVLIWIIRSGKFRGVIYCWYMVLYGLIRLILNQMRETQPFVLGLSGGSFWSLISIGTGIFLIFISYKWRILRKEEFLR